MHGLAAVQLDAFMILMLKTKIFWGICKKVPARGIKPAELESDAICIKHAPHMPSMSENGLVTSHRVSAVYWYKRAWEWRKWCDMWGMALWQSHQADCIHCMHTTCTTYAQRVRDRLVTSHRVSAVYWHKWAWEWRKWCRMPGMALLTACTLHAYNMHHICPACQRTDLSPVIESLLYIYISELESEESDAACQEWHYDNLTRLTAYIACIQHAPHMPSMSETDLSPVIKSLPYIDIRELESEESDAVCQEWHYDNLTKLTAYIARIQHAPHTPSVSETDLSPVIESLPFIDISELESKESDAICQE